MPQLKSQLCTREFLLQIKNQEVYAIKIANIRMHSCATPPTIAHIQKELVRVIVDNLPRVNDQVEKQRIQIFVSHLEKRAGDKDFMLDMLSTLC